MNCRSVFQHAQRHPRLVCALEFDMDERTVGRFARHIRAPIHNRWQLHVMPPRHLESGQFPQDASTQPPENALERNVVFVPEYKCREPGKILKMISADTTDLPAR
jgi:hypothetical protein